MLTQDELNALMAILVRAPITPGEKLWLEGLLARLTVIVAAPPAPPEAGTSPGRE